MNASGRRCVAVLFFVLALLTLCFLIRPIAPAFAEGTGHVTGTITDIRTGKPLPYANIVVLGTGYGAMSLGNGQYTISNLPVGTFNLMADYIGYEPETITGVQVDADRTTVVDFQLLQSVVGKADTVYVTAEEFKIDTKISHMEQKFKTDEMVKDFPIENIIEAIGLQSGVISTAGGVHVRGGRPDEIKYLIDGIEIGDPLTYGTTSYADLAISDTELLSGGFEAEYGNAQSGIVNITTKEGGAEFSGDIRFHTDDYGDRFKTYNNYDRLQLGFGGPTPVDGLTYYLNYQGTYQDTYLKTSEKRARRRILDFISIGDRRRNEMNLQMKLAYRMSADRKLTFETLRTYTKADQYFHMWSREGYVRVTRQTFLDASGDVTETRWNYGRWALYPEDSATSEQEFPDGSRILTTSWDEYYNAAEHFPSDEGEFSQYKLAWTHTLGAKTFYDLRVSRQSFYNESKVAGKEPWEYEIRYPDYWNGNFEEGRFFATHGDYPHWEERSSAVWNLKGDLTSRLLDKHTFKMGFESKYNDLSLLSIDFPLSWRETGPGAFRSEYRNFNPEGSFYVQDRWEHEGMVLNLGVRYDIFSPGLQIDASELTSRYKDEVSPRLGVAYPISERDVMSFHYGRFFQIPARMYVFENRGRQDPVGIRGNPDLEPETNVSYQMGLQHQFTRNLFATCSIWFKDIFGLISSRTEPDPETGLPISRYVNRDYASARGLDLKMSKRFADRWSAEINYSYQLLAGIAGDPEQGQQYEADFLYFPIAEQPLPWDQRHTLNAQMRLRDPGNWGVSLIWLYGSGFPYTPVYPDMRRMDPEQVNSERLPSTSDLRMQADKYFKIWGQSVTFFVEARNLLDSKNIVLLEPLNGPTPYLDNRPYTMYYTMTGIAGGAYRDDLNGDGRDEFVPVNDPRVFGEGRLIRMGLGITF
jgi:outer membrane receptor for ferrienterochelin and colicin